MHISTCFLEAYGYGRNVAVLADTVEALVRNVVQSSNQTKNVLCCCEIITYNRAQEPASTTEQRDGDQMVNELELGGSEGEVEVHGRAVSSSGCIVKCASIREGHVGLCGHKSRDELI